MIGVNMSSYHDAHCFRNVWLLAVPYRVVVGMAQDINSYALSNMLGQHTPILSNLQENKE